MKNDTKASKGTQIRETIATTTVIITVVLLFFGVEIGVALVGWESSSELVSFFKGSTGCVKGGFTKSVEFVKQG